MKDDKLHDRHKIAEKHERLLSSWIAATALAEVPLNQFRECSRSAICKKLKISRSTVQSNSRIGELFEALNVRLKAFQKELPLSERKVTRRTREANFVEQLEAKLHAVELKFARLQYLEDTGHLLQE